MSESAAPDNFSAVFGAGRGGALADAASAERAVREERELTGRLRDALADAQNRQRELADELAAVKVVVHAHERSARTERERSRSLAEDGHQRVLEIRRLERQIGELHAALRELDPALVPPPACHGQLSFLDVHDGPAAFGVVGVSLINKRGREVRMDLPVHLLAYLDELAEASRLADAEKSLSRRLAAEAGLADAGRKAGLSNARVKALIKSSQSGQLKFLTHLPTSE